MMHIRPVSDLRNKFSEIENIVSEFVTVIKEGKILKVRENTELYRGRNRDVLEVEYSIRK